MTSTSGAPSAASASIASIAGAARIGDHHRPGLGVDRLDLADAVVLLDRRGQLVLADAVGPVVGERGDRGEAGLARGPRQVSR